MRSVTHLVLAHEHQIRTERGQRHGMRLASPGSGFWSCRAYAGGSSLARTDVGMAPRPPRLWRGQKCISTGPCSFSWQRVLADGLPTGSPERAWAPRLQPSEDSRHGRIAFEIKHTDCHKYASKAAASNQFFGLAANPCRWLTAALLKSVGAPASPGSIRFSS